MLEVRADLARLKNAVEVCENVFADVMVARVDEENDVDDAEQRQQHDRRTHRLPDNDDHRKPPTEGRYVFIRVCLFVHLFVSRITRKVLNRF